MKRILFTLLLAASSLTGAYATNYYVSSGAGSPVTGVDATGGGRGLSPGLPFATIQYAADLSRAGDVVYVRPGTYTNTGTAGSVFTIRNSGNATNPITFRYNPGEDRPLLKFNTYNGIGTTNNLAYVIIDGFRIQGNNSAITNAISGGNTNYALNQPRSCNNHAGSADPIFNGVGIAINGRGATAYPNHITIRNCDIYDCGQAGITAIESDYITIDNNKVFNNSWYTVYGSSGISVLTSRNTDNGSGYHFVIQNNRVFGNELRVPWYNQPDNVCKGFTDGNGIIIDTNTQFGYSARTLIANNLVVNNGGAGITAFSSDRVDIINNTTYLNSKTTGNSAGEIVIAYSHDVLLQNNIVAASATKSTSTFKYSGGIVLNSNLFSSGQGFNILNNDGSYTNTNALYGDPKFKGASTSITTANFHLNSDSPAIDTGLNSNLSATDLDGKPRVMGSKPDRGAYEYDPAAARLALATSPGEATSGGLALEGYPNPFPAQAAFRYTTARAGAVRLEVVDALGRRVALLVDGELPAGAHDAMLAAPALARGLYYVRLSTPDGSRALSIVHAE